MEAEAGASKPNDKGRITNDSALNDSVAVRAGRQSAERRHAALDFRPPISDHRFGLRFARRKP
jgi:hypothetical protein